MRTSKYHEELVDGVGRCSRPMYQGGMECFCDAPAYGPQEKGQRRVGEWIHGRFYPPYVPALACYAHGGPKEKQNVDQ